MIRNFYHFSPATLANQDKDGKTSLMLCCEYAKKIPALSETES
jgi:hypothetical protein